MSYLNIIQKQYFQPNSFTPSLLFVRKKKKNMKWKKYLCISLALANTRVTFLFYLSIQLALDLQTITDVYDGVPPASGRGGEQMGSVRKCLSNHTTPLC